MIQSRAFFQYLTKIIFLIISNYGSPPASKSIVENLENRQLKKDDIEKIELNECIICKELFSEEEDVKKMPCNHFFHNACLITWLNQVFH